ncbi:MAG: PepSY-associated TM helix domain-containing protein [Burkholderiaceae bacterium]
MSLPLKPARRARWLRTLHQWHWVSAALSLAGMLVFSVTGLTLNNAAWVEASPETEQRTGTVPRHLLQALPAAAEGKQRSALPEGIDRWLEDTLGIQVDGRLAEADASEIYLSLPSPGADAWLAIDRETGELEYERRSRGVVAYLNDLHKGRHTGSAWRWFIDIFAVSCIIFSVSGLLLMKTHAANRPSTWPLLTFGALAPLLIMLLLIH